MNEPGENKLTPMAAAAQWTSRITTVSLEMVLPGIGGYWVDEQWGTKFLAPIGFVFGITLGMWHLIQMTKIKDVNKKDEDEKQDEEKK